MVLYFYPTLTKALSWTKEPVTLFPGLKSEPFQEP